MNCICVFRLNHILNFKVLFCSGRKLLCKVLSLRCQVLLHFLQLVQVTAEALGFAVVLAIEIAYPLKGLVRCGNCKRAMTRRKNKAGIRYFQCIHSVNNGNTDCPVGRSFPEMDIEKVVFHALTQFLALAQKEAVQNREVGDLRKSAIKECADKIRTLQKQNEQHKASKLRLYEKYAAGSITKEAYIQQKAAADVKIAENDEAIQRSHERMKELDSETSCLDEKLDVVCEQYADCKALTYELTHAFISAVYIYDLDNIEIVWKFKDFLTTSEGEAK